MRGINFHVLDGRLPLSTDVSTSPRISHERRTYDQFKQLRLDGDGAGPDDVTPTGKDAFPYCFVTRYLNIICDNI